MGLSLETKNVSKRFVGVQALRDICVRIEAGSVVGIAGPNGAGKSTLFGILAGVMAADTGEVWVGGRQVDRLPMHERARMGLARTFQQPRIIGGRTVLENVLLSTSSRRQTFSLSRSLFNRVEVLEARQVLEELELSDVALRRAGELTHAEQRRIELARLLARSPGPEVLLLDEPTVGMTEGEASAVGRVLKDRNAAGLTVVVISHAVAFLASFVEDLLILNMGAVIARGDPVEVLRDRSVRQAYVGA